MSSPFSSLRALTQMFDGKLQQFVSDIDNVHMVWLEEIQQEANRMFSSDFSAEPELMPKTPSQKKSNRRKRVSLGYQEENRAMRRFSKGKRSKLRDSSVTPLNLIAEDESVPECPTSGALPKRSTRRNKQTQPDVAVDAAQSSPRTCRTEESSVLRKQPYEKEEVGENKVNDTVAEEAVGSPACSLPKVPSPEIQVSISPTERLSAEKAEKPEPSPGRSATKIAIADATKGSRRSSARHSLKLRHSLAGLRHSMTQESVRRASRRSILKKRAHLGSSICSSNVSDDACLESDMEGVEEMGEKMLSAVRAEESKAANEELTEKKSLPSRLCVTRSMAVNIPKVCTPGMRSDDSADNSDGKSTSSSSQRSRQSAKRKAPDIEESPKKKPSPPKKSQSAIRPNMRSFLHTVQKNQMLMMTPSSLGRTTVMKSFIKHNTPLKLDLKDAKCGLVTKERMKLEALKKKQEQEEERMRKMEEEKRRKQEEQKRKRDERLKRVVEARVKEGQKEEEKKKKIEQNDKLRVERLAEEKAKKKAALKRQEEEAKRKKLQQAEEEKRQQELLAKRRAEEEEQQRALKLSEARRALELKREQEREQERERQAAAERERAEKEKAIALQRELEKAAREKERRELEEKRKELEKREQQRLAAEEKAAKEREAAKQREAAAKNVVATEHAAGLNVTVDIERSVLSTPVGKGANLNVTVDIEQSPQSYNITPKGGNRPLVLSKNAEDYGMDQNSDDSTDDESAPRKPIPSWAEGQPLQHAIMKQYFNPPDLDAYFGAIEQPRLENIFYKSKPRYFKRTSSAVWHSPPRSANQF